MGSLFHKVQEIDAELKTGIQRLAQRGNLKGLEIEWRTKVNEKYNFQPPAFSGKDMGNLKKVIGEYTNVRQLLLFAIERWVLLRQNQNLSLLGPLPTFGEFFSFRHKIYAYLEQEKSRLANQKKNPEDSSEIEIHEAPGHSNEGQPREKLIDLVRRIIKEGQSHG